VFHDYLTAIGEPSWRQNVRFRLGLATGDILKWLNWLWSETHVPIPEGSVTIDDIEVQGLDSPDVARLNIAGNLRYSDGETFSYNGPALAKRTADGWKVLDYQRDGRSQVDAIFTKIGQKQEQNNVILKVIGIVLQDAYTDVFVQITNNSSGKASLYEGSIVDRTGRQIGGGGSNSGNEIASHSTSTLDFFFVDESLPLNTRSFRFLLSGSVGPSFADLSFDVSVALHG
jgi:hypothetical protein